MDVHRSVAELDGEVGQGSIIEGGLVEWSRHGVFLLLGVESALFREWVRHWLHFYDGKPSGGGIDVWLLSEQMWLYKTIEKMHTA